MQMDGENSIKLTTSYAIPFKSELFILIALKVQRCFIFSLGLIILMKMK